MSGSGTLTFVSPEVYQGDMTLVTQDARRGTVTMQQQYRGKWLAAACK